MRIAGTSALIEGRRRAQDNSKLEYELLVRVVESWLYVIARRMTGQPSPVNPKP